MGNLGRCAWPNCACDPKFCKYDDPDAYTSAQVAKVQPQKKYVVLDTVWVIVYPGNKGIIYHPPGTTASEAWVNCVTFLASMQKEWQKGTMRKAGFRARRVTVQMEEKGNG